ncbi:DUF2946 domain-containing protein [Pseudomonas cichorii]|uniref:DUF2946 domain-containing protein n=1 Tax=Pseudomonas cichorii TaxID=36746 RepID=UPI000EFE574F|nr:DUF2946 domain-containing protein [Pseudomonas cichorii]
MKMSRDDRSMIAWVLYFSVLFSLFGCGIHHGQMSGLNLSGLNGGFCAEGNQGGAGIDLGSSDQTGQAAAQFSCSLCSLFGVAVALNADAWSLDYLPVSASAVLNAPYRAQPPPRYVWPSLNPRAPPHNVLAVNSSV